MAEKVLMLALSPTMESGTIAKWIKKEGDSVESGDILCEVETDKATMEYESIQEGTLLKIVVPEGGQAAVEQVIAVIGEKGEDISSLLSGIPAAGAAPAPAAAPDAAIAASPETSRAAEPPASDSGGSAGRVKTSPLARTLAEKAGIDIAALSGSGPGGRVVKRDVEAAAASSSRTPARPAQAAPAPVSPVPASLSRRETPVSGKRKIIAQRLAESMFTAPHYYLKLSVRTDGLMEARKRLNAEAGAKVSVNAFLMKYAAETIKRHPDVNSSWQGDTILTFGTVDIGLAVAQDDGLITPIVRDCGSKGIMQIDGELKDLIDRAQRNRLVPEEYTGATFTISSLGSFGVEEFTAIINPPGSAILAVGSMMKQPVVKESGEIASDTLMRLTLSCDHRVIDGAVGARFMKDLKDLIEDPVRALY